MLAPLRIITAGSVDDGKSTLIGRLLLDTGAIFSDQLVEIETISKRTRSELNLALITDGLRAERQQGITIDAGYRYFRARDRKIILADTPGHLQYTRNMVAAASNAEAAVILIDAARAITTQTYRHLLLGSLLGIKQFVICINKLDLCGYSNDRFHELANELKKFTNSLGDIICYVVPTSALHGDNIAKPSTHMPWYTGPTLLDLLESIPNRDSIGESAAFSVQSVIRTSANGSHMRVYAGKVIAGVMHRGHELVHVPSHRPITISEISLGIDKLESAESPMSVGISIVGDLDISRGDLFVEPIAASKRSASATATICWMADGKLALGKNYLFQQHSKVTQCRVGESISTLDVASNVWSTESTATLAQNEIGAVRLHFSESLQLREYAKHRALGAAILIDPSTNETAAAVMITHVGEAT